MRSAAGISAFRQRSISENELTSHEGHTELTSQEGLDISVGATGQFAFVASRKFQIIIGIVIAANIVEIALSTDMPHWQGWPVLDNVFLLIFVFEIAARIAHKGVVFFKDKEKWDWWGILDMVIVGAGVFDLWISSFLILGSSTGGASTPRDGIVPLLRFLRFFRLVRLLRVLRMSLRARQFVNAIVKIMKKIISIFVVLFMFLGCSSILLTHLLGHGEALPEGSDITETNFLREKVCETFKSVPDSFFALFQVTTVDNWDQIASPVVSLSPAWRFFFVVFIFFASWVMISVLTAVASDSMIAETSDQKELEKKLAQKRQNDFIEFLRHAFKEADVDGNGILDKQEFEDMISKDFILKRMRSLGVDMTQEDMRNAWGMMDLEESGELTIEGFVTGLSCLQEALSTKHVVNANYELKKMACRLDQKLNDLLSELDEVKSQNEAMLRCLQAQEKHYEQHQLSLWLWHGWASKYDAPAIPQGMALPIRLPRSLSALQTAAPGLE